MSFGGTNANNPASSLLGWVFIIFGCIMALGALFALAWIPEVQNKRDEDAGCGCRARHWRNLERA